MRALTLGAALAELLTEVLGGDAGTGGVAGLPRVVARLVVIHVVGGAVCRNQENDAQLIKPPTHVFFSLLTLQLNFTALDPDAPLQSGNTTPVKSFHT